jgi:hypothetical protein
VGVKLTPMAVRGFCIGLFVAGMGAGPVAAQVYSGSDLVGLCRAWEAVEAGATDLETQVRAQGCLGYFAGFWEGANAVQGRVGTGSLCVPAGVAAGRLARTFLGWAAAHADRLGDDASGLVLEALEGAYACEGPWREATARRPPAPDHRRGTAPG